MGAITSVDGAHVVVGDVDFTWRYPMGPDTEGRLPVIKDPGVIWEYEALCRELQPRRIVELGIHRGGSTAFLHALAEPERIVALELEPKPALRLSRYIAERGLQAIVRPHYGVDQADRARVAAIVREEFGDEPLDLVVDDASHQYAPTRASFEVLFPLLRPGGVYVIEDWAAGHRQEFDVAAKMRNLTPEQLEALGRILAGEVPPPAQETPLSHLAHELLLVRTMRHEVVESLTLTRWWTKIVRGTDPIDPAAFRLEDHYEDPFGLVRPLPPAT